MKLWDNIPLAFHALTSHRQRAILTMMIISVGLMSLVGIFSAIEAIKNSVEQNFSEAGSNTFSIEERWQPEQGKNKFRNISYREALNFKKFFSQKCKVSVSVNASFNSTIRYENKKTNPNVQVVGTDENYLITSGYSVSEGRMFTEEEVRDGAAVAVLGEEIKKFLFPTGKALHSFIRIGSLRCRIVGILKSKGAAMGFGGDRIVLLPLQFVRQNFPISQEGFVIQCFVDNIKKMNILMEEANGVFRNIRKLTLYQENDFEILRSDNITALVMNNISMITGGAVFIGCITLLGAAIGLMNIMLISVQERIREIGIRKAMGATRKDILIQFLTESTVIGVCGGTLGIILGIIMGNFVSLLLQAGLFIPWKWVIGGYVICAAVGIFSGIIPANKAAQVDPIESLRYE